MIAEPRPGLRHGLLFATGQKITFSAHRPFLSHLCPKLPLCECLIPAVLPQQLRDKEVPPHCCSARLRAQMPFPLGPPFSVFIDSLLVKTALLIWPVAFSPSVRRPETIPGRVVGGLYTGNAAESLHLCFLKTHVSFRGRMGRSGLAGGTLGFLEMPQPRCQLQGSESRLVPSPFRGWGTSLHGALVWGRCGLEAIPRSDVLFLTLETNSLGFRALTCLLFMVKMTPSLF